ncbi:MAG: hypothetical protein ABSH05_12320 [Bryobacteraceae bacterium]|jgi:hypothetical protein
MSKPEEAVVSQPTGAAAQEAAAIATPRGKERKQKDLARTMRRIGARLQRDFAEQIAQDRRKFKKRAVHYLKRCLPPFPGRPPEASSTRAIELRKAGLEWRQIYPLCIPGHSEMPPAVRRQAESNLRAACRSRRNAAKRRRRQRAESSENGDTPQRKQPAEKSPLLRVRR